MKIFIRKVSSSPLDIIISPTTSNSSVIIENGIQYDFSELSPSKVVVNSLIFENLWQFSKVYTSSIPNTQYFSKYDSTVLWKWESDSPFIDTETQLPTEEWMKWRNKGIHHPYPVKHPNTPQQKHKVKFIYSPTSLFESESNTPVKWEKFDYISSRKKIYFPLYTNEIKNTKEFNYVKRLFNQRNITFVDSEFENREISEEFLREAIDNSHVSFNHLFCLSALLLGVNF